MDDATSTTPAPSTPAPTEALTIISNPNEALALRLPASMRPDILALRRPTMEDLTAAVNALPDPYKAKFLNLVKRTNPKRQGAHTGDSAGFSPVDIKVYHGTGNDPVRPEECSVGHLYSAEGRSWKPPITGIILNYWLGRTLWPMRDASGGTDSSEGKGPICTSFDRKHGSKFGDCRTCPKSELRTNEGGCGREVGVIFIDQALTGIYLYRFAKTSEEYGRTLANKYLKAGDLWERWFAFNTESRNGEGKKKDQRWFVVTAKPVPVDGSQYVPETLHPLCELLSRMVDIDWVLPRMASTYDKRESAPISEAPGETVDRNALGLGAEEPGDDNPDFSKSKNI